LCVNFGEKDCFGEKRLAGSKTREMLCLFESSFSYRIWSGIFDWFGVQGPVEHNSIMHFPQFGALIRNKKIKKEQFIS
jgi:hypothetical protein